MKPPYEDTSKLGFGQYFTDKMCVIRYHETTGWQKMEIVPYADFSMNPACCVLHYAQEIFEGLKAYASADGRALLFRPEQNARRMMRSAERMCMPELPEEVFVQAVTQLVEQQKEWIPRDENTSLYIRPTMIATEVFLGVRPSKEYIFYIILSPVGTYYKEGINPVGILVEDQLVRAAIGGLGDAKTGANYAASLYAGLKAHQQGFAQVLYLDAKEHKYIEEVGSMNVFFAYGKKLVTPMLNGSILNGITRKSIIQLAGDLGYEVEERQISIDEVLTNLENGSMTELFGTGTAAVVSPVGLLRYKGKDIHINNNQVGPAAGELYSHLVDIQYGRRPDPYGWVREVCKL